MTETVLDDTRRSVYVPWEPNQNGYWWNETCAMVLEVFGLPGGRYTAHPTELSMTFIFNNPHDAELCKIMLSERL
jgi:hypothetical protein